jgi:hypothetical protein
MAHVCFDPEQMRMAGAWIGGGVGWPAGRDGLEGQPFADGTILWGTKKGSLGFSKNGDWKDPRGKVPFGPLPRDWAHWNGHYRYGEKTVLSYTVGDAEILELPAYDAATNVFTRTFNVTKAAGPIPMLVLENGVGRERIQCGVPIESAGRQRSCLPESRDLHLVGPKSEVSIQATVNRRRGRPGPFTKEDRDMAGSPTGPSGKEAGSGPIGRLTVQYDNPSKSCMPS